MSGKFYSLDEVLGEVVREGESCKSSEHHKGGREGNKATCHELILERTSFKACDVFEKDARL